MTQCLVRLRFLLRPAGMYSLAGAFVALRVRHIGRADRAANFAAFAAHLYEEVADLGR